MRTGFLFLAMSTVFGLACKPGDINTIDSNGNKVSVSAGGTKVTTTDDKGNTATFEGGKDGGTVTMRDEKGQSTFEAGKSVSESELGLPFYPGSQEKTGASMNADTTEEKTVLAVRTTPDEPAKVIEFYKPKVKNANVTTMSSDMSDNQLVTGELESGAKVQVSVARSKEATVTDVSVLVTMKKTK